MLNKRFLLLLITACALCLCQPLSAKQTQTTIQFRFAYNSESVTVSNVAKGFTASKITDPLSINNANQATFRVNCASGTSCVLRFTIDGTVPTTSVGLRGLYGDTITLYAHSSIAAFSSIRETSTDVILDTVYFR